MTTFSHFSAEPFIFNRAYKYAQDGELFKPHGLWLSVDGEDDWPTWCKNEDFGSNAYRTEIVLAQETNVRLLRTPEEIDDFTVEFSRRYAADGRRLDTLRIIDWARVARTYQGLIIAPYQWERRLAQDTFWYYTWDCASGCIWDLAAIAEVGACEPLPEKELTPEHQCDTLPGSKGDGIMKINRNAYAHELLKGRNFFILKVNAPKRKMVTTLSGRIGGAIRRSVKRFEDRELMEDFVDRTLEAKGSKGFVEMVA